MATFCKSDTKCDMLPERETGRSMVHCDVTNAVCNLVIVALHMIFVMSQTQFDHPAGFKNVVMHMLFSLGEALGREEASLRKETALCEDAFLAAHF